MSVSDESPLAQQADEKRMTFGEAVTLLATLDDASKAELHKAIEEWAQPEIERVKSESPWVKPSESPFHEQPMSYRHNVREVNGAFQVVEPKDAKP